MLSLSYFPLSFIQHLVFVHINITLESQVIMTTFGMLDFNNIMKCNAQEPQLFLAISLSKSPLICIFIAFLFVWSMTLVSRNDLKHGMHICCNIWELDVHAYFSHLGDFCYTTSSFCLPLRLSTSRV